MSKTPQTTTAKIGLKGAAVGGIVGITVWHILLANLLHVGFVAGLLILSAYMGLCMLLGTMIERFTAKD